MTDESPTELEKELATPYPTVESSSFYHKLGELHTQASSREEAQVALAISALKRLSTPSNEGWARSLLLDPGSYSKPNAYIKKERLAKEWFRSFLEMLVDAGAIDTQVQDSGVLYRATTTEQKNLLQTISNNAVYQNGSQVLRPETYKMTQQNPFEIDAFVASSEDVPQEARTLEAFVRIRYASADDRAKARFIIAFTALDRLLQKTRAYDRRNLLATPTILAKVHRQIQKEVASKEWSRALLDRWVASGMVSRQGSGASTYFRTTTDEQRNTIKDLIINCLYADGVELKKLIWPENYASIDASEEEEETEEIQQEEEDAAQMTQDAMEQFLQERLAGATDRDEARYVLAFNALRILALGKDSPDRKTLMTVPAAKSKIAKAVQKENMGSWFSTFLNSCVNLGLFSQTKSGVVIIYQVSESQKADLFEIIEDAVLSEGVKLKRILWPQEFPTGQELASLGESDESEQADGQGLDLIQELTTQLKSVAEHLQTMTDNLQSLNTKFDDKMKLLDTRLEDMGLLKEAVAGSFGQLMEAIKNDDRANLLQLSDKFTEMQSRRKSLSNQLEQESLKTEKLADQLAVYVKKLGPTS